MAGPVVPLVAPDMMRRTSEVEVSRREEQLEARSPGVVKGRTLSSSRLSRCSGRPL